MENETPSNVVARIRFAADRYADHACADFLLMAIDKIERLRARVVELEEAAKGAVVVANIASSRIRELEAAERERDAARRIIVACINLGTDGHASDDCSMEFLSHAPNECNAVKRERDELRRRIAVGPHNCPDWDHAHIRPQDPEMECCTCKPEA